MDVLMLFIVILTFLLSFIGTYFLINFLTNIEIIDIPVGRSNHINPTPRGAGIAVIISFLVGTFLYYYFFDLDNLKFIGLIIPIIILGIISFIDDKSHLSPLLRLSCQFIAVIFSLTTLPHDQSFTQMLYHILTLLGLKIPLSFTENIWLENFIVIAWWLWCINLYNFMDGINGITATQTICMMFGFIIIGKLHNIGEFYNYLPYILIAAILGFLPFNIHKARIFLGDVGSIPLGFIFGYLFIAYSKKMLIVPIVCISSYYIIDSSYTLIKRIIKFEKFWLPHTEHFFQIAVRSGLSHLNVVIKLILNSCIVTISGILNYVYDNNNYLIIMLLSNFIIIKNFTKKREK